jgi:hypothetical protein
MERATKKGRESTLKFLEVTPGLSFFLQPQPPQKGGILTKQKKTAPVDGLICRLW